MSETINEHAVTTYIKDNPVMVLGTVGEHNAPHGAATFVWAISPHQLYFVTKTETQKFKDIQHNPQVSVTIVNATEDSTLQATGHAVAVNDAQTIEMVMGNMAKIYVHSADFLPPIAKLRAGAYQVVEIKLHSARLAHYKGNQVGGEFIFKEG